MLLKKFKWVETEARVWECHSKLEVEPKSSQTPHLPCCLWISHCLMWHTVKSLSLQNIRNPGSLFTLHLFKTIHHKTLEAIQQYLMMRYHLSLQRLPGCFLDYMCHHWNASISGAEANGQPTLHPRESFGWKPAFMGSVSETSESIMGHKNPAAWYSASCTELS